ncbi:Flp family type IVb pilin [Devosia limi]|uniref:Pilus assembly protein Flp/PilA n=1 Tax=Devosia limi DSM 17137 TaxID=1121477 RepID=A0A1M5FX24_9HYPH|nr:pilus assembly protein Flp/PilA [Devosia limi DSM 17137]
MLARVTTRFLRDESGATAIEYGLIAAMIAVVLITTMMLMGDSLYNLFDRGVGRAALTLDSATP